MKKEILLLSLSALMVVSCKSVENSYCEEDLLGEWHEIMPVNKDITQGFVLDKDGNAVSVGMATLKYSGWQLLKEKDGGSDIVLIGKSIGNGQTIQFSDTLKVISINNDTLTLGKGAMYRIQYVKSQNESKLIGGYDSAMGYTYSKLLDKKIRIFEEGQKMLSAQDSLSSYAAYFVFLQDSSKVELFMPEESVILERRNRPDGTSVWNIEDDDTYMLEHCNNEWLITRRGKVLYSSTGFENILKAEFVNDNGQSLSTSFFTHAGIAQIKYQGTDYILYQYPTASGYGYKNSFADIRGKGRNMTLTLSGNNETIQFVEK